MVDAKKIPGVYEDKAKRLRKAYDDFLVKLDVLKKKRGVLMKKILQRIERDQSKKFLDELKK